MDCVLRLNHRRLEKQSILRPLFFFFTIAKDCRSQTNTNLHTDYCYRLLSISKGPQSTFKSSNTVLKVSSRCDCRSVLHVSLTYKSYNRWRSGFITKRFERIGKKGKEAPSFLHPSFLFINFFKLSFPFLL